MDNFVFYIAQFFALCSSICLLFSFWQKKRKKILYLQSLDSTFDIIQYFLLGAYSGALTSALGAFRAIAFQKNKNKRILYCFLLLYIIVNIITFQGYISFLPMTAALIYTLVVWNQKEKNIRVGSIFVFILWFMYDILVGAYVSMITDSILIISNFVAIIKLDYRKESLK